MMKLTGISVLYAGFAVFVSQFRAFEIVTTFKQNELFEDYGLYGTIPLFFLLAAISTSSLILWFIAEPKLRSKNNRISQWHKRHFDLLILIFMMFNIGLGMSFDTIVEYLQIKRPLKNIHILTLSRMLEIFASLIFLYFLRKAMRPREQVSTSIKNILVGMRNLELTQTKRYTSETCSLRGRLARLTDKLLVLILVFAMFSSVHFSWLIVKMVNSPTLKAIFLPTALHVLVGSIILFCLKQLEARQKEKISSEQKESKVSTISDNNEPGTRSVVIRVFMEPDDENTFQRQETDLELHDFSSLSSPLLQLSK